MLTPSSQQQKSDQDWAEKWDWASVAGAEFLFLGEFNHAYQC